MCIFDKSHYQTDYKLKKIDYYKVFFVYGSSAESSCYQPPIKFPVVNCFRRSHVVFLCVGLCAIFLFALFAKFSFLYNRLLAWPLNSPIIRSIEQRTPLNPDWKLSRRRCNLCFHISTSKN